MNQIVDIKRMKRVSGNVLSALYHVQRDGCTGVYALCPRPLGQSQRRWFQKIKNQKIK